MADTNQYDVTEDEGKEIMRIATEYFRQQTGGDEAETNRLLNGLANLVKQDGIRLVHLGNTLFLVLVKGKRMVEVHTMAVDESASSMAKNFVMLANYLKGIGVRVAYTYADDDRYEMVAKRSRLPFQKRQITMPEDGKVYTAYYLEL
jgi:hypothetical protein